MIYWGENDTPSKVIIVKPVPFRSKAGGLGDVIKLQEKLLRDFVECDGRLATLMLNKSTWETMVKLAAMLPVVGQEQPGFDIEPLAEASDLAQLGRIFFSGNIKDSLERETDADGTVINAPSLIAKIHDINFSATLFRLIRERDEADQQERMKKLEANLSKLETSPVVEISK
ncbi:hypothetical protein BZZ01_04880 [Nostocales cyanobacterium HT-58-2]|nr:hypothetical protein BZZ01_04880 [Nostocales cyanobacterium HT-58-2]